MNVKAIKMKTRQIDKEYGRTIIELMVAMTISFIIVLGIVGVYFGSHQSYRTTDDKSRLDEDARLALHQMAQSIRMAGYGALLSAKPLDPEKGPMSDFLSPQQKTSYLGAPRLAAIFGCSGKFTDPKAIPAACTTDTTRDSMIVRYKVDTDNANATATNLPTDCLGQAVVLNPTVVENRYYIASNPATSASELYCAGNGGTSSIATTFASSPQPIAENVVAMQLTYGFDSDGDQSTDNFLPASAVTNWDSVVSVRICLVMRTAGDGLASTGQQYRDCNNNLVTPIDRRIYGAYSTVVTIRSRASGSTL